MPYRFSPPIESPVVRFVVGRLAPWVLRTRNQVATLVVSGHENLPQGRALLLPNHPSETEPAVLALLAERERCRFYFLATHELFVGLDGWIAQRMGAFSVRRGWPDRTSLTFATQLLREGKTLVVFPEGETHQRGNELLPLKRGAAQLGFWALERAPGSLPLVPIHVAYSYLQPEHLFRGVAPLERALGIAPKGTPSQRLYTCGLAVLARIEQEYGLTPQSRSTEARIAQLYTHLETAACRALGGFVPTGTTVPVRLRALFNAAFDQPQADLLPLLWRLQNFMAVRDEVPDTYERFGELLFRLEKEVYGRARTLPLRRAHLQIGAPLELSLWQDRYHRQRQQTLHEVTGAIEQRLQGLLERALLRETPLEG